jgi:osmotically-inducible protein OsmY
MFMRSTKAFVLGISSAYFFDPAQGRRRRNVLRDRSRSVARRTERKVVGKFRFVAGRSRGFAASSRRPFASRVVATDDATVAQRIRSDAFRAAGVSTREVEVEVEDGVASLQGSVEGPERADALVQRVAKVPGVRDVAAMIRVSDRRAA